MSIPACQCPIEGFCARYQRQMVGRSYTLCQTRAEYRQLWDDDVRAAADESAAKLSSATPCAAGGAAATDCETIDGLMIADAERLLSPRTPVSIVTRMIGARSIDMRLFNAAPGHRPNGWWNWSNVQDAYAAAADRQLSHPPEYPAQRYAEAGIVICGGGKYFASTYVTVRAIRHVGCTLPIEIWYRGVGDAITPAMAVHLKQHGVDLVDADAAQSIYGFRRLRTWEIKPLATLHSRFREVLYLDADCYPVKNPELLLACPAYRSTGAVFWPDIPRPRGWTNWSAFRTQDDGGSPIDSGQYLVNKQQCWRGLQLACWYNEHSDFTYRHMYGDQEAWNVAFVRAGMPLTMYRSTPRWVHPAYIHDGPDGEPLFVHRTRAKFVLDATEFFTPQSKQPSDGGPRLPLEAECQSWLAELRRAYCAV